MTPERLANGSESRALIEIKSLPDPTLCREGEKRRRSEAVKKARPIYNTGWARINEILTIPWRL